MAEDAFSDPIGQLIADRYELVSVVGRGGHGLVFAALDRRTNRRVAVKLLNDAAARDPQQMERLRREQQALVALEGTSAVRFIDLCVSPGGRLCLVMELLDGIDLEQRLEELEKTQQPLSVSELVKVLGPIVDTLETAHRAGILHRDLKPANIFLMSEHAGAGVRLLDFGLVRLRSANPLTAAGTVLGSPSYIAPEVWKGSSDGLDQRVDVYSFGVVVYRSLSGRLPFEAASLTDKFILATTAPRPSLVEHRPDLPIDVDHWISEAMSIDRDHRFTTIRAAWNALLASLETDSPLIELPTQPAHSTPEPPPEPQAGGLFGAWRAVSTAVRRFALGGDEPGPPGSPGAGEASLITQLLQQSELQVEGSPEAKESKDRVMDAEAPTVSAPPVGQSGQRPAAANETVAQSSERPAAANETVAQSSERPAAASKKAGPPPPPVRSARRTPAPPSKTQPSPIIEIAPTFEVESAPRVDPAPASLGPEKTLPTGQAPPKPSASRREHTLPIEKPKPKKRTKRAVRRRGIRRDPLAAWMKRTKAAKKPRRSKRKKKGKRS